MYTTIQVKQETKEKLSRLGDLSSTYDSILNELLEHVENCQNSKLENKEC